MVLSSYLGLQRQQVQKLVQAYGGSELMLPRAIIYRDSLPLLTSGKFDYAAMQKMAQQEYD